MFVEENMTEVNRRWPLGSEPFEMPMEKTDYVYTMAIDRRRSLLCVLSKRTTVSYGSQIPILTRMPLFARERAQDEMMQVPYLAKFPPGIVSLCAHYINILDFAHKVQIEGPLRGFLCASLCVESKSGNLIYAHSLGSLDYIHLAWKGPKGAQLHLSTNGGRLILPAPIAYAERVTFTSTPHPWSVKELTEASDGVVWAADKNHRIYGLKFREAKAQTLVVVGNGNPTILDGPFDRSQFGFTCTLCVTDDTCYVLDSVDNGYRTAHSSPFSTATPPLVLRRLSLVHKTVQSVHIELDSQLASDIVASRMNALLYYHANTLYLLAGRHIFKFEREHIDWVPLSTLVSKRRRLEPSKDQISTSNSTEECRNSNESYSSSVIEPQFSLVRPKKIASFDGYVRMQVGFQDYVIAECSSAYISFPL